VTRRGARSFEPLPRVSRPTRAYAAARRLVRLAPHEGTRGSPYASLGNLTCDNAKGRHNSHSRARTNVRQGVLVRRQCVAEADGRRCDPVKRRRSPSQKEGAVCVAGGLAESWPNGGVKASSKPRQRNSIVSAGSWWQSHGNGKGPRERKRTGRSRGSQRAIEQATPHRAEGIPGCGYRVIVTDTRFSQSSAVSQGRCVSANRIGAVEKRQGCQRYGEPARGPRVT